MKFKNYINSYNRNNRIFSDDDILKMTLDSIFDNEDSIMAQHSSIGIPTVNDLEQSPNTEWVKPYVNVNGENDGGYWKSKIQDTTLPKTTMPYSENTLGTFAPINGNNPILTMKNSDNSNESPLLTGGVEKNVYNQENLSDTVPYLDEVLSKLSSTKDKYEGLNAIEAVQKAASKMPIDTVEREYYGLSSKLKDREMIEGKTMEENDIYSLKDITDPIKSKQYAEYLSKMYNLDPDDPATYEKLKDKQIVVPKETSRLYNYAKNSEVLQRWVAENYDRIKNGEKPSQDYVEFPLGGIKGVLSNEKRGLFATLHNMDIKNAKVNEDGALELGGMDPYDFDIMKDNNKMRNKDGSFNNPFKIWVQNKLARLNNRAYNQQETEQLENFLFSMQVKYSKEEIEEILKNIRF